ncbi:MAG: hypothetical protein WBX11_13130 [Thiobacillaceae bacterium]
MLKINHVIIALGMLLSAGACSTAQVGNDIPEPGTGIGINLPAYPELDAVPGYPVYYAPQVDANYFFYDGTYWLYQDDNWYASSWYNGPWGLVSPGDVPAFVLRVPVRYYHHPPAYFRGWGYDAPPRWGEHWGHDWEQRRNGWDRWDRGAVPAPAPLPVYQRQYSGDRYPRHVEQQQDLNRQNYRYQPKEPVVHQHYPARQTNPSVQGTHRYNPPPSVQQGTPAQTNPAMQGTQRYSPPPSVQPGAPQQKNALPDWMQGPRRNTPPPSVQPGTPLQTIPSVQGTHRYNPPPSVQQGTPAQTNPAMQGTQRYSPPPSVQPGAPQQKNALPDWMQGPRRNTPPPSVQQGAPSVPHAQPPQQGAGNVQKSAPTQAPYQRRGTTVENQGRQPQQGAIEHQKPAPGSQGGEESHQGRDATREPRGDQSEDRARDHNDYPR